MRKTDFYCPNCGLQKPTNKFPRSSHKDLNKPLFFPLMGVFSLLFFFLFRTFVFTSSFSGEGLFVLFVFSLLFSFIPSILLHNLIAEQMYEHALKKRKIFNRDNLLQKENVVSERILDLSQRIERINTVLRKIGDTPSRKLEEIGEKLLAAREVVIGQFVRYELQKKKIELVRLQNQVMPYLEDFDGLKDYQTENGIVMSEQVIREVGEIGEKLSKKFPESFRAERDKFLRQLDETADSCRELREVLLSKQALHALEAVQPIREISNHPPAGDFSHTIETFNVQTGLTDFGESFDQLETEYKRLLTDSEISEKLLNYEN